MDSHHPTTPPSHNTHKKLHLLILSLCCLCFLRLSSATADPFMAREVVDPPFQPITYSIQAFLWWNESDAAFKLDNIRTMVFSHVKQTFAWHDIQPIEGEWEIEKSDRVVDEIERRGLKLVARLTNTPDWAMQNRPKGDWIDAPPDDYADFANYCRVIASRYRGRIAAYQIWNEPNLAREWGGDTPNAAEYVELLKACSDEIRANDPDAIIISAGLAPTGTNDANVRPDDLFLQDLYDANFHHYVDVVGAHAPGYSAPDLSPDEAVANGSQRFFTFRRIEDLRKIMIANNDAARQMAILEFGWTRDNQNPDYMWYAVDEDTQAENMVAAYRYAAENWRPWVGLMSAIYMGDSAWTPQNEEYHWSIVTPEGYFLPAYARLANMAKYCGNYTIPERDPGSPEALGIAPVTLCTELGD